MNYKVTPVDEGEEPPEFLDAVAQPPKKGFAKEIKEDMELKFEVGGSVKTRVATGQPSGYNENVKQEGPIYTGGSDSDFGSAAHGGAQVKKEQSQEVLAEIIETLHAEAIPDGLEREMVIMGDTAYSVTEKSKNFLGKKSVERVMEPISTLPEGLFFAEGYTPRVHVQNQQIVAIEFLKKKEE